MTNVFAFAVIKLLETQCMAIQLFKNNDYGHLDRKIRSSAWKGRRRLNAQYFIKRYEEKKKNIKVLEDRKSNGYIY